MNIFFSALYRIMEWISRFAYIQILWLLFTLLGLGLLGFFPATISMLAVMRDWFLSKPDSPIFRTFWSYYKKEFIRANLFGMRSEEHTSELQSRGHLVCRRLLEKKIQKLKINH